MLPQAHSPARCGKQSDWLYTSASSISALHYQNGAWSLAMPQADRWIIGLGLLPGTSRGWISYGTCQAPGQSAPAQRAHFDAGQIAPDRTGAQLAPNAYALLDDTT